MPGFQAFKDFKDGITVMIGDSVAGYKLKPFVLWHSANPRAFMHSIKHTLPENYNSNGKSRKPRSFAKMPS